MSTHEQPTSELQRTEPSPALIIAEVYSDGVREHKEDRFKVIGGTGIGPRIVETRYLDLDNGSEIDDRTYTELDPAYPLLQPTKKGKRVK